MDCYVQLVGMGDLLLSPFQLEYAHPLWRQVLPEPASLFIGYSADPSAAPAGELAGNRTSLW